MRSLAILLAALMSASSAHAITISGTAVGKSCGSWLEERKNDSLLGSHMEDWVSGYLSGATWNGNGEDPLSKTDTNGVWYWIDNYCRERPASKLIEAVKAFYEEFSKKP
jgi:hypothetical protein